MTADDVDMYHVNFTSEVDTSMSVLLDHIDYKPAENCPWEINTVKFNKLSTGNFLENNDVNVTALCFHEIF